MRKSLIPLNTSMFSEVLEPFSHVDLTLAKLMAKLMASLMASAGIHPSHLDQSICLIHSHLPKTQDKVNHTIIPAYTLTCCNVWNIRLLAPSTSEFKSHQQHIIHTSLARIILSTGPLFIVKSEVHLRT